LAGSVLPKFKIFMFLSILCMLINWGACLVGMASDSVDRYDYLENTDNYDYQGNLQNESVNITAVDFATTGGTSFIPFASILSLSFVDIDDTVFIPVAVVVAIIGALQVFLLVLIGLCFVPNVLGSGMEV